MLNDGNTLYRREKYEEAAHRYQYAVRRVPQFISSEDSATFEQLKVHLYLNLSRCCKKQGLFDEAAKHASSVLKLKPDSIEALKARASVLKESGKYQEAISSESSISLTILTKSHFESIGNFEWRPSMTNFELAGS